MKSMIGAAITAAMTLSAGTANSEELIFGISAALTGEYAPFIEVEGAKCMADKLNKAGGPDDLKVKILSEDNRSEVQLSISLGQKFLDEGAQLITGVPFPDALIPLTQLAKPYDAIVFSAPNTQQEMHQPDIDNFFTVAVPDSINAAATANAVYDKGARNAVILTSKDIGSWSEKLPEWFADVFERRGGKVIGRFTYSLGTSDWSPQIASIKALPTQPDVIEISTVLPDAGIFIRQLRANGYTGWVVGSDGFDDQSLNGIVGDPAALDKVIFATHAKTYLDSPADKFLAECKAAGFKVANVFDALGGEMVLVTYEAAKKAGSVEPAKLREALRAEGGYLGLTSDNVSFAQYKSYPVRSVPVIGFENGKRVLITDKFPTVLTRPELVK
ncbi:ABC transporter substrate-binding protein [Mesorhizobium sp. 2RAF21]|uniref:ABC transporter substrate-binding protein n=1 Tax=Mesorhizobium sp. 2RAF21 TaxID=3232995 RepID=UPI003F96C7DF